MAEAQIIIVEEVLEVECINLDFPVTAQENVTIVEVVEETVSIISVSEQGLSGPRGLQGNAGPQGAQGVQGPMGPTGPGDKTYVHIQNSPALTWPVNHNLGKRPTVALVDSADSGFDAEIVYIDDNNLNIVLAYEVSGKVYCN